MAGFNVIASILPVLAVAGIWYVIWRVTAPLRRRQVPRDAKGREIERTRLARFGGGNLDWNAAVIAKAGTGVEPRQSLNVTVMRPSLGLKALMIVLSLALLYLTWSGVGAQYLPVDQDWVRWAISAAVGYAALNIMIYEARYDSYSFWAPNWALQSREYLWKDLVSLKDDGHYLYKLTFEDGRKAEVQKYLVGIRDFVSYAQDRIEENRRL